MHIFMAFKCDINEQKNKILKHNETNRENLYS